MCEYPWNPDSSTLATIVVSRTIAYDTLEWISRDPIGEAGGINLYGYVYNDPAGLVDPLGLLSQAQYNQLQTSMTGIGAATGGIIETRGQAIIPDRKMGSRLEPDADRSSIGRKGRDLTL